MSTTLTALISSVNQLLGTIDGKIRNKASKTELESGLASKANKSETLTPEQIEARIQTVIGSSPEALDTLAELASALNNDPDFAATITQALTTKATKAELESAFAQLTDAFTQGAETIGGAVTQE